MLYKHPVIDGHYHILEGWTNYDGMSFVESTAEYLRASGLSSLNICAVPFLEEYNTDVSNNIMAALCKLQIPNVYIHGGLVYDGAPVPEKMIPEMSPEVQYRELTEIGFDGIKMLETKPSELRRLGRSMDEPLYENWFSEIEKNGTHMVWHVADPAYFWKRECVTQEIIDCGWYYGDGSYPTQESIFEQVENVLKRHPMLKVTFAHFFFCGDEPEKLEDLFAKYPNVNVDITPGWEMYESFAKDPAFWNGFFTRHADRIGFGTDSADDFCGSPKMSDVVYTFLTESGKHEMYDYYFTGIALDDDTVRKIVHDNFTRRVGEDPKPINRAALKRYIEKYRHLINNEEMRRHIDRAASEL